MCDLYRPVPLDGSLFKWSHLPKHFELRVTKTLQACTTQKWRIQIDLLCTLIQQRPYKASVYRLICLFVCVMRVCPQASVSCLMKPQSDYSVVMPTFSHWGQSVARDRRSITQKTDTLKSIIFKHDDDDVITMGRTSLSYSAHAELIWHMSTCLKTQ